MISQARAIQEYEEAKKRIASSTPVPLNEHPDVKKKRIAELLESPEKFCKYYFPQYFDPKEGGAELGWFHKKAAKEIRDNPKIFLVAEWPREHAKSVFLVTMMSLYLKARNELTGVVVVSNSGGKAQTLLSSVQAQLESNKRFINDFGEQYKLGSWTNNEFITRDDVPFWALGKGQNPRGLLYLNKRPNLCLIDDFDDDEECRNEDRVSDSVDWLFGALLPCFAILGSRKIMLGNRIHKKSCLAHVVGDVEEGDTVRPSITHIKVFALENPKTHTEDQSEKGVPAWKERYTREVITTRIGDMTYRMAQREYFHKHIEKGTKFKPEWIIYDTPPPLSEFEAIVTYNDPSFKDTKKNDYKGIVAIGKVGLKWWILDIWLRQETRSAMINAHYAMHLKFEGKCKILKHFIEANFTQDSLRDEYHHPDVVKDFGFVLNIENDLRSKPEKKGRIEGLTVYYEKGYIIMDSKLRNTFDGQNYKDQLLGFPSAHDDGPDAVEGGIFKLRELTYKSAPASMGGKRRNNEL